MLREKESWPEFLQRLRDLKYRVRRLSTTALGYDLYWVDLSDWKLSFSDRTPIIWINAELLERFTAEELAESLRDLVREKHWRHRERIILLDGDGQELKSQITGQSFSRFLIVDAADQQNILHAPSFTGALLKLICEQIPISSLAPYQYSAPVEGAGFFGRKSEIEYILRHPTTNFAIIGVRRIGKTSLLKEIRRRMIDQGESPARIVWLDCSTLSGPVQFVEDVVRQLNIRELPRLKKTSESLFSFSDFLRRMSKMHGGIINIFLDEADPFLGWARDIWLPALRASVSSGDCRYIVTGFQTVMSEPFNHKSPFYLAFESLNLGPFDKDDVKDVIRRPMRSLHVSIEDEPGIITRVHTDTRGHPYLVQFCCVQMVKQLEREGHRMISLTNLTGIYASEGFKDLVLNSFRDNVSVQDKVLVYALLKTFPEEKDTFTQKEMYVALAKQRSPYSTEEIDRACSRLVLAGVHVQDVLKKYQFAFPFFPRVLRANHELDHLLSVAKKEIGL